MVPDYIRNNIQEDVVTYVNQDTHETPVIETKYIPEPIIPDEPSALSIWIHNFFSDRPLAKI